MKISIKVDLTQPHTHYISVEYLLQNIDDDHLILTFPVWSPGSYLVREYQSQVEDLLITEFSGQPIGNPTGKLADKPAGKTLKFVKQDKNSWFVDTSGVKNIRISYKVYTHELNVRSCYLDHTLGFFNPTSVFFYIESYLHCPVDFSLQLPPDWKVSSALKMKNNRGCFENFDIFYDTPFLMSDSLVFENFTSGKTKYVMAFWGTHFGDTKKISKEVRQIVSAQSQMFGSNPCSEYHFQILFVAGKYGGLEHAHSSTNLFDGSLLTDEKKYREFLSLLSHEHFHLWNVKRIRPRELGPFDYARENYTRDLWISEGFTSYYDDLFVWRAGLMSAKDYLDILAENIAKYENQYSKKTQSLSDSSFDSWIKLYRPTENSTNRVMSYYLKGLLVAHVLNWQIMQLTDGKKSIDDVMRGLYRLYLEDPSVGFTRDDFWKVVSSVAAINVVEFEKKYIDGLDLLTWDLGQKLMGFELKDKSKTKNNFLGLATEEKSGKLLIRSVVEKSPAFESDLRPGDELLGINGHRIDKDRHLDPFLKQKKLEILFSRFNTIYKTNASLVVSQKFDKKCEAVLKPSPAQKKMRKKWLGKPW